MSREHDIELVRMVIEAAKWNSGLVPDSSWLVIELNVPRVNPKMTVTIPLSLLEEMFDGIRSQASCTSARSSDRPEEVA